MGEVILHGITLGCILALSVGPVIFTIIKQSINTGKEGGFSFVTGVWISDIFLIVISNGFSELVVGVMKYKAVIGVVGSLFLLSLGIYYIFFKKVALKTDPDGNLLKLNTKDLIRIFSSGFLINSLNPNIIIFWFGVATTFAVQFSLSERFIIFGICLAVNIAADCFKVLLAGRLRKKLTLQSISIINKVSGTILIAFGVALAVGSIFFSDNIQ